MSLSTLAVVFLCLVNPVFSSDAVQTFVGSYSDPNHPGMARKIYPLPGEDDQVLIKGTDDGSSFWMLTAEPHDDTIVIDFSSKGGPADLEGKWDGSGIAFPDGNKWTKITNELLSGLYADPEHPGMERRVYAMESGSLMIKGTDDGNNYWVLTGKPKEDTVHIDFSPKGGPTDLAGKWDGSGLVFPDGNKWTKVVNAFVGYYFDPQHPKMERQIYNTPDNNKFVIRGTEDGTNFWTLPAEYTDEKFIIDITEMGGPSDLEVKWDGVNILFPDGTKWVNLSPSVYVGKYTDPQHPTIPREVVLDASQMLKVKGSDDGQEFWELPASIEGMNITIDFSPKGGPASLKGTWDGTGIVFPDGNKWTKSA